MHRSAVAQVRHGRRRGCFRAGRRPGRGSGGCDSDRTKRNESRLIKCYVTSIGVVRLKGPPRQLTAGCVLRSILVG